MHGCQDQKNRAAHLLEFAEEFLNGLFNALMLNGISCLILFRIYLESLNSVEVFREGSAVLTALETVKGICFVDNVIRVVLERDIGKIKIVFLAVKRQSDGHSVG